MARKPSPNNPPCPHCNATHVVKTRFVVAGALAPSEEEATPTVVAQTRRRTQGQQGVFWVSDGRWVYSGAVRRVYRDSHRLGKRGRPALVPMSGVGLTQGVKHRQQGRVVRVVVRQVMGA